MAESARVYIERMKSAFGVVTDEALAAKLDLSKQAVANWRRRGRVPDAIQVQLVNIFGPDMAADKVNEMLADAREDDIAYAAAMYAYERANKNHTAPLSLKERLHQGLTFRSVEDAIRDYLRENVFTRTGKITRNINKRNEEILSEIMSLIDENKFEFVRMPHLYFLHNNSRDGN